MTQTPPQSEQTVQEAVEEFDNRYEKAWITEKGRHNHIRWLLKSWLIQALTTAEKRGEQRERERIRNYQHGFVRDDGTGEPERAPEWQVIEDLLQTLTQKD